MLDSYKLDKCEKIRFEMFLKAHPCCEVELSFIYNPFEIIVPICSCRSCSVKWEISSDARYGLDKS